MPEGGGDKWKDRGETPARDLPSYQPPVPRRPLSPATKVMLALTAVALIAAGVIGAMEDDDGASSGGNGKQEDLELSRGLAFEVCKDFVSDRLRSPGSAKFRNFFEKDGEVVVFGSGDGPYTVTSTVDSQNGFGALIRSDFSCTVTRDRAADRWLLNSIDIS